MALAASKFCQNEAVFTKTLVSPDEEYVVTGRRIIKSPQNNTTPELRLLKDATHAASAPARPVPERGVRRLSQLAFAYPHILFLDLSQNCLYQPPNSATTRGTTLVTGHSPLPAQWFERFPSLLSNFYQ